MSVNKTQESTSSVAFWRKHKLLTTIMALMVVVFLGSFIYSVIVLGQERARQERLAQPSAKLLKLRARDDSLLTTYGVVDSARQLYRIPIDSAMVYYLRDIGATTSRK